MTQKIKPEEGNKYFCIAPWTHTYLSPQSERRLCCASREKASWVTQYIDGEGADLNAHYNPVTLEEHWNSPYMMGIRKKIMNGEKIPECDVCHDKMLNIHVYKDYFTKTLFPHKIDEAFEKTDENGFTTMKPISYDYRLYNTCNFKCRMCGDQLSSAWENENRKRGVYDQGVDAWATKKYKPIIEKFQKTVAEEELWNAVYENRIEEIYWVGGEPLVWDIHWEIMDYLVKNRQSENVIVRYNTNLSKTTYKNHDLYSYLPYFKGVQVCASIDGVGSIVEYIRDGCDWNKWLENFKRGLFLNEKYGEHGMVFDLTVTSPGLFSIKDLIDITAQLNVNTYIKTTFSFDSSVVMSPMMIPREMLNPIIDDIINYANEKTKINPKIQTYVDCFQDIKNKPTFHEKYEDANEGIRQGKQRLYDLDSYREKVGEIEKIFSNYPPLLKWWNNIKINNR